MSFLLSENVCNALLINVLKTIGNSAKEAIQARVIDLHWNRVGIQLQVSVYGKFKLDIHVIAHRLRDK